MSLLEFNDVSFDAFDRVILDKISFKVEKSDFISIIGHSGSGKSTLLKMCCNLISPTKGNIIYDGKDYLEYSPEELRRRIAYIFQTPYLFGDTVMDNMKFPYIVRNIQPDVERIKELFSDFQMSHDYLQRDIYHLSGGEKQRIALIRSLLFVPDILLLDEITSALDSENTAIVENMISSLNNQGTTILWITHNLQQSKKYANKILTLESGTIKSFEEVSKNERNE